MAKIMSFTMRCSDVCGNHASTVYFNEFSVTESNNTFMYNLGFRYSIFKSDIVMSFCREEFDWLITVLKYKTAYSEFIFDNRELVLQLSYMFSIRQFIDKEVLFYDLDLIECAFLIKKYSEINNYVTWYETGQKSMTDKIILEQTSFDLNPAEQMTYEEFYEAYHF